MMAKDKNQNNIYDEVKSHSIYKMLTKDLNADEVESLNEVIQEFSNYMQVTVLDPAMETVRLARAAASQKMINDEAKRLGVSIEIETNTDKKNSDND